MSRIECGYRDVRPAEVVALASALGLRAEDMLGTVARPDAAAAPAPMPPQLPQAESPKPSGSNLDDPANFTELPDTALLDRGSLDEATFRARLTQALARATRILHTSRVPAATWRAWREFERMIQDLLRAK